MSSNQEINYIIDEKPELNPNSSQNLNKNLEENINNNLNLNQYNINQNPFQILQHHEIIPLENPQELFIIPESLEASLSKSSSDNSIESDDSLKKVDEEKNTYKINDKLSDPPQKKKVELSISENKNFSYENLNKLFEGSYTKDKNLKKFSS